MHKRLLIALTLALFIAGCGPTPRPGVPVTHANACDAENNDKRVSIEGYPRLQHGLVYVSDDFAIDLFEQPQSGGKSISVYLKVGTGANQAEDLPDNYTDTDLKIHTRDNQVVSTDTRIRVTGSLSSIKGSDGEVTCFINEIDLIEAAPAGQ